MVKTVSTSLCNQDLTVSAIVFFFASQMCLGCLKPVTLFFEIILFVFLFSIIQYLWNTVVLWNH